MGPPPRYLCRPPHTPQQNNNPTQTPQGAAAAEAEEDDSEDYPPAWVADQKRLRDELDWEKPYMREKPRNWDLITGLPVPRRIKIEQVGGCLGVWVGVLVMWVGRG